MHGICKQSPLEHDSKWVNIGFSGAAKLLFDLWRQSKILQALIEVQIIFLIISQKYPLKIVPATVQSKFFPVT